MLKRKNRNVAICACARKLAVIAWYMLKNNEPYRYAQPSATECKLSKLRVTATNERRKTGPKKGSAPPANFGTGVRTHTTPSLPTIYEREGIPAATPPDKLTNGELRILRELGVGDYVEQIQSPSVRTRTPAKSKSPATEPVPGERQPADHKAG
jgi:hypothetical protein